MTLQQQRVPSLTFTAVKSDREVRLDQLGRTTAIVCLGQSTLGAVDAVVEAIRTRYPEEQVPVVTVADLQKLPKLLRKVAEMTMNGRYDSEAKKLREGLDPEEYVVILPDWDGQFAAALGLGDVDKELAVVVATADGHVAGVHQGSAPGPAAVETLDAVLGSGS